jgi:MFS family permease
MRKPIALPEPPALDERWRNLIAAMACMIVFDVTIGFSFPVLTLMLETRGVDGWLIGLNAAMTPVGLLLVGPFIPAIAKRFGAKQVAVTCAAMVAGLLLLLKAIPDLYVWFALRLALGATTGTLFAISEAWVVRFSEGPNRGTILAIYASLLSAGFSIGPFMIPFTGIEGWLPFLIAAGFAVVSIMPILLVVSADAPEEEGVQSGFLAFLPKAPVLLLAVGVFALMDVAALTFLPLYGLRKGLDLDTASIALGVMVAGNIFLQLPIGYYADRWSKPGMMILCALLTAVFSALIPISIGTIYMWPVFIIVGASGFGIYTVALALLGERFSGPSLVAGAAAFATMWGVGAIIGAPAAAGVMELFGPDALPYSLAAVYLIYGVAFSYRQVTRHRKAA